MTFLGACGRLNIVPLQACFREFAVILELSNVPPHLQFLWTLAGAEFAGGGWANCSGQEGLATPCSLLGFSLGRKTVCFYHYL